MKELLEHLFQNQTISEDQARSALTQIIEQKHDSSLTAAFLTVFRMRSVTVSELLGFRNALMALAHTVDFGDFDCIDMCGTGGDGKNTFNISTLSSLIVAGAGVPVAKHGNYGASSICGSSKVLETLGVRFTNNEESLKKQLDKSGYCFLHAPLFHEALKSVAPIRKALGVRTIFNLLGPLCNPAGVKNQVVGVFSLEIARLYSAILTQVGTKFSIVHSLDGYDELSLTDKAKIFNSSGEHIVDAQTFDTVKITPDDITCGDSVESASKVFLDILECKGTEAQSSVVCANAALAINVVKPDTTYIDCYQESLESLKSGRALKTFKTFCESTNEFT